MVATHPDTVAVTERRGAARAWGETKPSFKTTELLVFVLAVAGVLVAAAMDDSINAWRAWLLVSALAVGYMLSRGLAKSGSRPWDGGEG
jgi:hypothetical protein